MKEIRANTLKLITCFTLALSSWLLVSTSGASGFSLKQYEVTSGDFDGDGRTDYAVREKREIIPVIHSGILIPITIRPSVPDFLLRNTQSGEFELQELSSSTSRAIVSGWGMVDVKYDRRDINVDGHIDLVLQLPNEDLQMIFSDSEENSIPVHVKALDEDTGTFFSDVWLWLNSTTSTVTQQITVNRATLVYFLDLSSGAQIEALCEIATGQDCFSVYGEFADIVGIDVTECEVMELGAGRDPQICSMEAYHVFVVFEEDISVEVRDYSVTHPDALGFGQLLEPLWDTDDEWFGNEEDRSLYMLILESIFGARVFDVENQEDPNLDGVNAETVDNWYWARILYNIASIYYDVCVEDADGDDQAETDCADVAQYGDTLPSGATLCTIINNNDTVFSYNDYSITPDQRAFFQNELRREFWLSRYQESCDPFARAALSVVDNVGLGRVTLKWLDRVAQVEGVTYDEFEVGMAIIEGHIDYTDSDTVRIPHLLSKRQITDYHVEQFALFGLPAATFGGAPTGTTGSVFDLVEWFSGTFYWCMGCDTDP